MSEQLLQFTEEELEAYITYQDLRDYFIQIIDEIRKSQGQKYQKLIRKLEEIKTIYISISSTEQDLFDVYEKIQSISIELRQLLPEHLKTANYDKINYAFYYQGKRYTTDEIRAEWLTKNKKTGELQLDLKQAIKDLESEIKDKNKKKIQDLLKEHYEAYRAAIEGTYKSKKNSRLNAGYIGEAFEEHLTEHHSQIMKTINSEKIQKIPNEILNFSKINYWANHESINIAWKHMQMSYGTQRGTVAGDVYGRQVKALENNPKYNIRLARFRTLEQGIQVYSKIIGNESSSKVAAELTTYFASPIRKMAARVLENISEQEVLNMLTNINETIIKERAKQAIMFPV